MSDFNTSNVFLNFKSKYFSIKDVDEYCGIKKALKIHFVKSKGGDNIIKIPSNFNPPWPNKLNMTIQ